MTTRLALLIASPGTRGEDGYLPGTKADIDNYVRFLKSPLGGAWTNSEIVALTNPSKNEVDDVIRKQATVDYSFTTFSGHGRHVGTPGSTYIQLNKTTEIDSILLRKGSKKHTLVIDCCRVLHRTIAMDSAAVILEKRGISLSASECRKYFDEGIDDCASGLVVMVACTVNQTAGETSHGGYYSGGLIEGAENWLSGKNTDTKNKYATLTVVAAHERAAESVISLSGGRQRPEIEKPRADKQFPFAIIA